MAYAKTLVMAAALTALSACSDGPTAPSSQAPVVPNGAFSRVTIIDGWTGAAVPNVRVSTAEGGVQADGAGAVSLPVSCAPATFAAPGFLERRVRCLSATVSGGSPVALWPVRDDVESLETRHFVGSMLLARPDDMPAYLSLELQARSDVLAVWSTAADEIRRLTANRWLTLANATATKPTDSDDYYLVAPASSPLACDHPWYPGRVPLDSFGFCMGQASSYFGVTLRVAEARLATSAVATRALLYASGARAHEMPGLLNGSRPDPTLSEFERKTLHMVGLRGRVGWPDDEMCSQC